MVIGVWNVLIKKINVVNVKKAVLEFWIRLVIVVFVREDIMMMGRVEIARNVSILVRVVREGLDCA